MSEYENVVVGKLKLKGKALDVKSGGVKKKKKHQQTGTSHNESSGGNEGNDPAYDDHLTPAERKYIKQRAKLDTKLLVKPSNKSHRVKIQDFNQYLANLGEHYDIPKVGPAYLMFSPTRKCQSVQWLDRCSDFGTLPDVDFLVKSTYILLSEEEEHFNLLHG
ncbi:uncharacterized protein LOC116252327 [Nymphaea colorata]|nr:uncharacterized protein LOC116252327 [Nymphaea colorata]